MELTKNEHAIAYAVFNTNDIDSVILSFRYQKTDEEAISSRLVLVTDVKYDHLIGTEIGTGLIKRFNLENIVDDSCRLWTQVCQTNSMTKFESKKKKPDWDSLISWEQDNNALAMWVLTPNCIRERMAETDKSFKVSNEMIYEFCYQSRRGWDMEAFKNSFKDFVIENLEEEIKFQDPQNYIT